MHDKNPVDAPQQEKAYVGQANTCSAGLKQPSDHAERLRSQLRQRQWKLEAELREVADALNIINTDETVNKVLKVFEVAGK